MCDNVINRDSSHLSTTYTHEPFNKLTGSEMATFGYDPNGNMVWKSEGSKRFQFAWDYENRLTAVSDRKTRQRHVYDALGRRVQTYGGPLGSVKFTYDGPDVVMDDSSVSGITKYQNGPDIDNKLSVRTGASVSYFLADHLGSTVGLADATGAVTSQTGYDAFGNQTGTIATRYGFTGREYDSFTGLYYYRARMYDPNLGRFISEDPIGFAGGDVNLYGYTKNNPLNFRDPFGLSPGVTIVLGGIAIELGFHYWMSERSLGLYPSSCDPKGRKKHCYVNCMSTRAHLLNPAVPTAFSLAQEAQTLVPAAYMGNFQRELSEAGADIRADIYGQSNSILLWRSCYSICMEYPE